MADNELHPGSDHEDERPGSNHNEDKDQAKLDVQLANALVALSSTLNLMDNHASTALPGWSKWVKVNLEETDLEIYNNFDAFVCELKSRFSHADPVMEAAEELENLKMTNNHHITKYDIEFTHLATLTSWNNTVLYHSYYKGLPDQIKDILTTTTKSATLSEPQETARKLDVWYWEYQCEKKHSEPSSLTPKSDSSNSNSKDKGKKKKKGSNNQQSSNNLSNSSGNLSTKLNNNYSSEKKDYTKYLTLEGKLTDQECNRCVQNKLCLICASNKHMADGCPVKQLSSDCSKAKGCQAQIADPPKADISTSSGPSSVGFYLRSGSWSQHWLTCHNPLIDWASNSITFHPDLQECPTLPHTAQLALSDLISDLSDILSVTPPNPMTDLSADLSINLAIVLSDCLHISLINASTFMHASRLPGSLAFTLDLITTFTSTGSAKLSKPVNLSSVLFNYHNFADVFSKSKMNELPPHHLYNLKINLKEGSSLPVGTIYLLLQVELQALREFIDKNLAIGFIHPSTSPHGAPVLFVHKKDAAFQCFRNNIFNNLLDVCITVYLDDILIYLDDIASHKDHLIRKGTPWNFTNKHCEAFETLKKASTCAPVLTHWVLDAQIVVKTDASDYALTAILSIIAPDSNIHPVAFHSHTFNPAELNYDIHDKELLAIFEAFQIWQHYLEGGNNGYAMVNPHNFHPVFTHKQLAASLQASDLYFPTLCAGVIIDYDLLHKDILAALPSNLIASQHLSSP
ncbi:hypothetical protein NP233_g3350 [Leucocoprinus birnbaumii]|uniref:Reverse transcriptase/retrotransposon-derived protein RNase H-like domain-containing protein n=1 Tax=Leucocoprinus birnbaumii TaxID=56174 RepID=A0AAD5VX79_9AGAR|nr:hypothetical protein NP233_g3350 [Leucocoprinus birnbaumii]